MDCNPCVQLTTIGADHADFKFTGSTFSTEGIQAIRGVSVFRLLTPLEGRSGLNICVPCFIAGRGVCVCGMPGHSHTTTKVLGNRHSLSKPCCSNALTWLSFWSLGALTTCWDKF